MSFEPWRSWQAMASSWMPPPAGSNPAPFGKFVEQFQKAAASFLDAQRSPPAAGHKSAAFDAFTRFLREQFAPFGALWGTSSQPPPGFAAGVIPPGEAAFGASREYQELLRRMADASARIAAAQQRLQMLWLDALREAAGTFVARITAAPQTGNEAIRALYDRWIDCAEDAYAHMAHSQSYCDALADYINASSQWRTEQQILIEHWAKLFDLPTRSELNTLLQRVESLEQARREPTAASQPSASRPASPKPAARRGAARTRSAKNP